MRRRLLAVALLVLVGQMMGPQAFAHPKWYPDPDDTKAPIDLKGVGVDHDDQHLTVTWNNYDRFTRWQFKHGAQLIFQLNRGGDINFVVQVDYRNGEWVAAVCYKKFCDFGEDRLTPATFVDVHRIRVVLERDWFPAVWKQAGGIQFQAMTYWPNHGSWDDSLTRIRPDGGSTDYHHMA